MHRSVFNFARALMGRMQVAFNVGAAGDDAPVFKTVSPPGEGRAYRARIEAARRPAGVHQWTRQIRRAEQRKAIKRMSKGVAA